MRGLCCLLVLVLFSSPIVLAHNRVMPWMCLQRCNETIEEIEENLEQLQKTLGGCVTAVSFERYNLGANGTLVVNTDLYPVGWRLNKMGLETYPMISSWPYPPAFLDWMRYVEDSPCCCCGFDQREPPPAGNFGRTKPLVWNLSVN